MKKIRCPLGHEQKSRSGFSLNPDDAGRICDVCGVVFAPRVTNKELYKQVMNKWKNKWKSDSKITMVIRKNQIYKP